MSSSSDEDDELDAAKLAALRSVAIDSSAVIQNASAPVPSLRKSANSGNASVNSATDSRGSEEDGKDSSGLKLYQTRLQDLLYKHLDKKFGATTGDVSVTNAKPSQPPSGDSIVDEGGRIGGIRLFRRAPPGIVIQKREEIVPSLGVKPNLRPSLTLDEDSEEHLVRLRATVVDTETVEEQGKRWREKSLASAKALQEKAGLAKKKEEERVAQLKRERGEEWLPSIAAQIAKEAAKEPKVPKVDPATLSEADGANSEVPQKKKKKRKSKASRKQLGVVVD
ncbi:uncharacterized protein [Physcomitrium patens]|uniref:Uncharacterized protein n=1 Tax=Physcomitrium patens TaxID=3218 RepID=A9S1J4_PHYPA|nr:uncharacterized protein LOC112282131 [Physcomitrium patens]PNR53657.1 hypothetical protein PHYPA_007332 [Physcomitrium patens]|eukprot:XP_024375153.1 uncharacterized protein LOC112282131 [Physcomitrella patens]